MISAYGLGTKLVVFIESKNPIDLSVLSIVEISKQNSPRIAIYGVSVYLNKLETRELDSDLFNSV